MADDSDEYVCLIDSYKIGHDYSLDKFVDILNEGKQLADKGRKNRDLWGAVHSAVRRREPSQQADEKGRTFKF